MQIDLVGPFLAAMNAGANAAAEAAKAITPIDTGRLAGVNQSVKPAGYQMTAGDGVAAVENHVPYAEYVDARVKMSGVMPKAFQAGFEAELKARLK